MLNSEGKSRRLVCNLNWQLPHDQIVLVAFGIAHIFVMSSIPLRTFQFKWSVIRCMQINREFYKTVSVGEKSSDSQTCMQIMQPTFKTKISISFMEFYWFVICVIRCSIELNNRFADSVRIVSGNGRTLVNVLWWSACKYSLN